MQSGKQCLCKYVMPSPLGRAKLSGISNTISDLKIVELADAVEGRVSLVLNNGQVTFFYA